MSKNKSKDNFKKIKKDLKKIDGLKFRWGARGMNNARKFFYNEFGTNNIPERPAMRITFNSPKTHKKISDAVKFAIRNIANNKDFEKTIQIIGLVGQSELKKTFRSSVPPPNKESTIKRKGRGKNTLYDTGELFRSLGYDIIKKT